MILLYMIFLLPLTIGQYHRVEYGQHCSDSSTRITNRATCQAAAAALGLSWGNGWWGPNDFPGCLHTRDPRNRVYFNYSPYPSMVPNSLPRMANYAEICTGYETSEVCEKHYGLVLTGGDSPFRTDSSELISSMGVCGSPKIPNLSQSMSGGKSLWIENIKTLMFCGGSNSFRGEDPDPNIWGATETCFKVQPGDYAWTPAVNMNAQRSWFSLNSINENEAVAAGGLSYHGTISAISDSLEKYSSGVWTTMGITLPVPRYGHCAVHYNEGPTPHLMIIGGSINIGNFEDATSAVIDIDLTTGHTVTVDPLGPLPALWAPACTIDGEYIYVSGGGSSGTASKAVYRYNLQTGHCELRGNLHIARSGHIMGMTAKGELMVAGGFHPPGPKYPRKIETSDDGGATWKQWTTELPYAREYAAMASVPAFTVECH